MDEKFSFLFFFRLYRFCCTVEKISRTLFLHAVVLHLQPTEWRIGAGGLPIKVMRGYYLSNPHFPPPLRQTARYLLGFLCLISNCFF
jgi:hypothetical protein